MTDPDEGAKPVSKQWPPRPFILNLWVRGISPKMAWEVANVLEMVVPRQSHGPTRKVLTEVLRLCRVRGEKYETTRGDRP